MSEPDCTDVCEIVMSALHSLGFKISDDSDHTDILEALYQCKLVKKDAIKEPVFSENYPITFDDKGMRDFLQENFRAYFKVITLTDEEIDQFKRHLEASISDWISENWRDFTENRGD